MTLDWNQNERYYSKTLLYYQVKIKFFKEWIVLDTISKNITAATVTIFPWFLDDIWKNCPLCDIGSKLLTSVPLDRGCTAHWRCRWHGHKKSFVSGLGHQEPPWVHTGRLSKRGYGGKIAYQISKKCGSTCLNFTLECLPF